MSERTSESSTGGGAALESDPRILAYRASTQRFVDLVEPLTTEQLRQGSYASEWTIADVASHLGSQAEIFALYLQAGLTGGEGPGREQFAPIWDTWNARTPPEQASESVRVNRDFQARVDAAVAADTPFAVNVFGMELDLAGFVGFRVGEHVVHTWDIAAALDPAAELPADAVPLLLDVLPNLAGRSGKAQSEGSDIAVTTTDPERHFVIHTGDPVSVTATDSAADDALVLPAEAFVRLVYGRLAPTHTPAGLDDPRLDTLRAVFQGF